MKNFLILNLILLLVGCNKNPDIYEVISSKKVINEIDVFINDLNNDNNVKFIMVSGIENPETQEVEILFNNYKPTFSESNPKYLKEVIMGRNYGYFKYKNYEFLVEQDLKNQFKLNFEEFGKMKKYFKIIDQLPTKEELIKNKWKALHLKYHKKSDSIEFSNITEMQYPQN